MARLLEAVSIEDREAYRAVLDEILLGLALRNVEADKATVALFDQLRRQTSSIIADLGAEALSGPLYERTLAGIDASMTDFANRWGINFEAEQLAAFNLGEELGLAPLEAGAGLEFARFGPSTDQLRILAQFRVDLVGGVTDDLRKRIRNEVAAYSVGARSFTDAARAIGRNLDDANHFRTVMHRARAILQTETGRAQAIATQGAQARAAEDVPNLRKRWINAHLPGSRASHLAAEARYAENGLIGPIPVDEPFAVAGRDAMYPHDPSLPASESVHCKCVVISVLIDPAVTPDDADPSPEPPPPLTDADTKRQADQGDPLTPRQRENAGRYERLAAPMVKPAGWDRMTKAKRLAWIEARMEADFPVGEEWRSHARIPKTETVETPSGRRRRRTVTEVEPRTPGTDLRTTFGLTGMDPEAAFRSMNELRRLSVGFPEVAERLAYVGTYRGAKSAEWKIRRSRQFSGEYAHASHDGRRLGINPSHYGDFDALEAQLRRDHGADWHPVAGVESVIIHEFGHHVENWLGRYSSTSLIPVGARAADFQTISAIKSRFAQTWALGTVDGPGGYLDISRYAVKSTAEGWAETFAAYWYRRREISWLRETAPGRVDNPLESTIGARPSYGPEFDRGAHKGEVWLDRFGRFMDLLTGTRLDPLPSYSELVDYRTLTPAEQALHDQLRNQLIDDLGGEFFGVTKYTSSIEELNR